MLNEIQALATVLTAQAPAGGCGGGEEGLIQFMPIILMIMIFYFIVLRPARKERETHSEMLKQLKRGDEVLTQSGFLGTISDFQDPFVVLEIARNTKVKVLRSSIAKKHQPAEAKDEGKKDKK